MNIAEYSLKNRVVTWLLVIILVAGGATAYEKMGKLEFPAFTLKEAQVITYYPGASPEEVRSEVTYHVEEAVQQLEQLLRIKMSISREGYSEVQVEFKEEYRKDDFPNIYDELRRKIHDMRSRLPPGAMEPIVVDDFADVYGTTLALTGSGYSYRDLKDFADRLKTELVLVPGVRKVVIQGDQEEAVYVELSRARMAKLGIPLDSISRVLESQNVVADSGRVRVGDEYLRIEPSGEFKSVREIGDVLVSSEDNKLVYLKDIARIWRGYKSPPQTPAYSNGQPALIIGISMQAGENVVAVGQRLEQRLGELAGLFPVGMELNVLYNQPEVVDESVKAFVVSVVEALVIVIVVLLIFMGLRTGLIIGAVLLITVAGTLWIMDLTGMELQRISLGALIIALGMLVDNAIVVAEGMLVRIKAGTDAVKAAREVVGKTMWPLLGGTIVGILAFAAIGLSRDGTGEFVGSLFYVILISLTLSWITAVTVTPMFCAMLLKPDSGKAGDTQDDPYQAGLYRYYKAILEAAIRFRWLTVGAVVGLFVLAVVGFGFLKEGFFPDSSTPMFFVDLWEIEGTDIRKTRDDLLKVDDYLRTLEGVVQTTAFVGGGAPRFTLVYAPESNSAAYGQIIVQTDTRERIAAISKQVAEFMRRELPNTEPKVKNLRIGPGRDSKIEARFSGPDPKVLRQLSRQAQDILHKDPEARDIRDDWRQPVKLIRPVFNEKVARTLGISRQDLAAALKSASEGLPVGIYRDGIRLLPIILQPPEDERENVVSLRDIHVWSPVLEKTVPVSQIVSEFQTRWEDAILRARDRQFTIIASANPKGELVSPLFARVRPQIEAIELPPGYKFEWGGEYEDATLAEESLGNMLPATFLLMILTVILLFGKLRQPLIIWLTVPLAVIGISAGLLLMDGAFDFMALLGALSLTGLLIKNSIVLIEQIDLEIEEGKPMYRAIVDSSVSRLRPVMMAASTTILGMVPLLPDVFFVNMALTIMFGLGFATILTLVIVPVLYAILFKVPVVVSTPAT